MATHHGTLLFDPVVIILLFFALNYYIGAPIALAVDDSRT